MKSRSQFIMTNLLQAVKYILNACLQEAQRQIIVSQFLRGNCHDRGIFDLDA
jgi:hypothetical protein